MIVLTLGNNITQDILHLLSSFLLLLLVINDKLKYSLPSDLVITLG